MVGIILMNQFYLFSFLSTCEKYQKRSNDNGHHFKKYGGGMNLADWRRLNVNNFVKYCAFSIKTIKPWVQFYQPIWRLAQQISRSRGSDTNSGQTNYDDLFADPVAWMENCWIDYYFHNYIGVSTIKRLLMQN
jgi:uncharacterized lipoprotein YddW (UPF0748 family)